MAPSRHHAHPGPAGGDLTPSLNVLLLHLFAALKELALPTVWMLRNQELYVCQCLFITCTAMVQTCLANSMWLWLTWRELHSPGEEIKQLTLFSNLLKWVGGLQWYFLWLCAVTKCCRTWPFRHFRVCTITLQRRIFHALYFSSTLGV